MLLLALAGLLVECPIYVAVCVKTALCGCCVVCGAHKKIGNEWFDDHVLFF